MSSIVAQLLTGTASGAPKDAAGAAGLFAPKGEADAAAPGGFEALLTAGASASPAPRPSDAPAASLSDAPDSSLPETRLTDAAADGGAPSPVDSLAAALRAARQEARAGGEGREAVTRSVSPRPGVSGLYET
jgi:hypothetical protein